MGPHDSTGGTTAQGSTAAGLYHGRAGDADWASAGRELFALRWCDVDDAHRCLTVHQAVYEGRFDTPKTAAGARQIPLSDAAMRLLADWSARAKSSPPEALVFSTWSGKPISPNNVARQQIFPACVAVGVKRATWLTFRRTYSS
jgi:integrase